MRLRAGAPAVTGNHQLPPRFCFNQQVEHFNDVAHEVWVPSGFVKEGYVASGVRSDKVNLRCPPSFLPEASCRFVLVL